MYVCVCGVCLCDHLSFQMSLRDRLGIHTVVKENWYALYIPLSLQYCLAGCCCRYDMLTPGEAQRVSFARIFYHMPPFVCK